MVHERSVAIGTWKGGRDGRGMAKVGTVSSQVDLFRVRLQPDPAGELEDTLHLRVTPAQSQQVGFLYFCTH